MVTKAPGPDESVPLGQDGDPVLASYYRLMRLKRLYRQGWLKRGVPAEICESVAEHSFGTALLGLLLTGGPAGTASHEGRALDSSKVVLMALVHEMGESYAGDITPVDGVPKEEKMRLEREAIGRSLGGHPDAAWFLGLWEEFEEGLTPEARFVRELDRLEMGLEAALYRSEGYLGMGEFFESSRSAVGEKRLRAILEEAIAASTTGATRIAPPPSLPPPPRMPPASAVPVAPSVPPEPSMPPEPAMPGASIMPSPPRMPDATAVPVEPDMPPPPVMPSGPSLPAPPALPPAPFIPGPPAMPAAPAMSKPH